MIKRVHNKKWSLEDTNITTKYNSTNQIDLAKGWPIWTIGNKTKKLPEISSHFSAAAVSSLEACVFWYKWFIQMVSYPSVSLLNNFIFKTKTMELQHTKKSTKTRGRSKIFCWSPQHWATTEVQGKMLQCRVAFSSTSPGFSHHQRDRSCKKLISFLFFSASTQIWNDCNHKRHHKTLEMWVWLGAFTKITCFWQNRYGTIPNTKTLSGTMDFNYHLAIITADIHCPSSHPEFRTPEGGPCQWAIPQRPSFFGELGSLKWVPRKLEED